LKKLKDILSSIVINNDVIIEGDISGIAIDSRKVKPGFLFIAYKGVHLDGHQYIDKAIEAGCRHVVLEDASYVLDNDVQYVLVDDARLAASRIAANYYNHPSESLTVIGVTGTNGKTTVSSLMYELLTQLDVKAGLISTIDIRYNGVVSDAVLTTPDALSLQELFNDMRMSGVTHVVMEVSSHALHQNRVADVDYDLAVFTNITHDHLDYHGSFSEYIKAKQILFDNLKKTAVALVNIDDRNGDVIAQGSRASKVTYSLKRPADYKAKIISNEISGLQVDIDGYEVYLRMIGQFNVYNALAVYSSAVELGFDALEILKVMSNLNSAEGRMDFVRSDKVEYTAVIDYAHTPDALEKVLKTLSDVKKYGSQIITVVGAGGNRDKAKRPKMAYVANQNSDVLILTSDNPRNENAEAIIEEMLAGIQENKNKVLKVSDRREAIKLASVIANQGDIILIAGKGHEKYQEINGQKLPFDDKEIISALMH
jgi:UDP-N-acetylmuramoyl-L-alanyl-D-glutamate--2,6-diaminopimelate ligase